MSRPATLLVPYSGKVCTCACFRQLSISPQKRFCACTLLIAMFPNILCVAVPGRNRTLFRVEIEHYSVAYFGCITTLKHCSVELLLRAGLISHT